MEKGDALLQAYSGKYVIESFNPAAVNWYKENRPEVCRGQLSWWPYGEDKPTDPVALGKEYAAGALVFDWISRPDFVAYDWKGGNSPQVKLARFMVRCRCRGPCAAATNTRSAATSSTATSSKRSCPTSSSRLIVARRATAAGR